MPPSLRWASRLGIKRAVPIALTSSPPRFCEKTSPPLACITGGARAVAPLLVVISRDPRRDVSSLPMAQTSSVGRRPFQFPVAHSRLCSLHPRGSGPRLDCGLRDLLGGFQQIRKVWPSVLVILVVLVLPFRCWVWWRTSLTLRVCDPRLSPRRVSEIVAGSLVAVRLAV